MTTKLTKTQKAMSTLGAMGGKALVRKKGKGYMKKLSRDYWKTQKSKGSKITKNKK